MGKGTEIEIKNLGEKTGIKLISDDQGKVVIATEANVPLQPTKPDGKLDETAIHDNEAGEISAIAAKASPVSTDVLLGEDSENDFAKVKIAVGDLGGGGGGATTFDGLSDTPVNKTGADGFLVKVDGVNLAFIDPSSLPVASHTHVESDITDLGAYLDEAAANALYSALGHTHVEADITDLGAYLDQAAADLLYSALGHTHTESEITDLDHTDTDALHLSGTAEISALTEKTTPIAGDFLLLQDGEAGDALKKLDIDNLPGGGSGDTRFDIPHNSQGDDERLRVVLGQVTINYVSGGDMPSICVGDILRAFEHGTSRTGQEPGEEFTKHVPPQVALGKQDPENPGQYIWTAWNDNVWAETISSDPDLEGPTMIFWVAASDGWDIVSAIASVTFIAEDGNLPS
jgi:hypothetical protein